MTTYQEKAEKYVRKKLPELMELSFGCEVRFESGRIKYTGTVLIRRNSRGMVECFADNQIVYVANEDKFEIIGHPIQPHHWLKALRTNSHANWMLASVDDNFELIDMTDYGTKKFKNHYMIIGHENFYKRFCEEVSKQ